MSDGGWTPGPSIFCSPSSFASHLVTVHLTCSESILFSPLFLCAFWVRSQDFLDRRWYRINFRHPRLGPSCRRAILARRDRKYGDLVTWDCIGHGEELFLFASTRGTRRSRNIQAS